MKFFILFSLFLLPFSMHAQVWTTQTSGTTDALIGVYFAEENTGWVVGNPGRILHTMNGGNTWLDQSVGNGYLTDVHFFDEENGWAVGYPG